MNEKIARKIGEEAEALLDLGLRLRGDLGATSASRRRPGRACRAAVATSSSGGTEPSPCTSTASMKPGLAMNSSAVGASNNAHVALPGEMMSSYSMMPTSVNVREPLSALTFTSSPSTKPPSCAVSVSSATSSPPAGSRPSFTRHTDRSPSLTVAPNVGAVGRSIGSPSLAMTTASPCTDACASADAGHRPHLVERCRPAAGRGARGRTSSPPSWLLCT